MSNSAAVVTVASQPVRIASSRHGCAPRRTNYPARRVYRCRRPLQRLHAYACMTSSAAMLNALCWKSFRGSRTWQSAPASCSVAAPGPAASELSVIRLQILQRQPAVGEGHVAAALPAPHHTGNRSVCAPGRLRLARPGRRIQRGGVYRLPHRCGLVVIDDAAERLVAEMEAKAVGVGLEQLGDDAHPRRRHGAGI